MSFFEYSAAYQPAMPVCQIRLGPAGGTTETEPLEALIDTGADLTIVPTRVLREIGAKRVSRGQARSVWGDTRSVDVFAVALSVGNLRLRALRVVGDDHGDEIILGRTVLNRLRITLDGPAAMTEVISSALTS